MNTTCHRLLGLALITAVIALPACKKAAERVTEAAIEHATGTKVDKDGNAMTIKTENGDVKIVSADAGGNVALPAGFPSDIYLPGERKVASVVDMAGMQMVNLTSPGAIGELYAEADKTMQGGGWKREMAMQSNDGSTLMFSKDKRQVFYQLVKADGGGTQLAIRTGTNE